MNVTFERCSSFGRFYIFFTQSSLLFQDFMAFRPPKCTLSSYQDQGMDRRDMRLPEASSSRVHKSIISRKYLKDQTLKAWIKVRCDQFSFVVLEDSHV